MKPRAILVLVCCYPLLILAQTTPTLDNAIDLYQEGLFEEALPPLEQAHRQQATLTTTTWLGLTYFQLGQFAQAEPLLRSALAAAGDIQVRQALVEILLASGRLDNALSQARQLPPTPSSQYLLGRVLTAQGDSSGAISAFEAALSTDEPRLLQLLALELIPLYLDAQRDRDAGELATRALNRDPSSFLALELQSFATELSAATPELNRPLQLNVGYRFEYDDNVFLAPDDDTLVPDDLEDPENFRHTLYGDLLGRYALGHGLELFGEAHIRAGFLQDLDNFDTVEQNYVASLGWSSERFGLRLPVEYSLSHIDSSRFLKSIAFAPGVYVYPRDDLLLYGYYRLADNDYTDEVDPAEARSGKHRGFGLLARWQLPDQRSYLRGVIEMGDQDTDGDNWQSEFFRAYLYGEYFINDRLSAGLGIEYLDSDFDNIHDRFFIQRDDEYSAVFATLRYQLNPRWQIQLQGLLADGDSNIALYRYERNIVSVGLSWQY